MDKSFHLIKFWFQWMEGVVSFLLFNSNHFHSLPKDQKFNVFLIYKRAFEKT